MKHYVIVGRIPGDDEDTAINVGMHASHASAYAAFDAAMRQLETPPLTSADIECIQKDYGIEDGRVTYVIHTIVSDAPMEVL
jgi:hypothetical protein